jgi:long-chain acyl-CoA synthetase
MNMVTLVNKFIVKGKPEDFERVWMASSEFMKTQPGFLSYRFIRSLSDPRVYFNVAEWTDAESHTRVMRSADFRTHLTELAAVATPEANLCEVVGEYATAF